MQEFSTKAVRHEFRIDGRRFWLPGIRLADFEAAAQLDSMTPEQRIPAFRDFIATRVRPFWFGRRATRKLNIVQLMDLWKGWVGLPGEAGSSSPDSSPSIATSSPTTSDISIPPPSGELPDTSSVL
jgi:hypothetical protein